MMLVGLQARFQVSSKENFRFISATNNPDLGRIRLALARLLANRYTVGARELASMFDRVIQYLESLSTGEAIGFADEDRNLAVAA
jgi:hypothetical protein